jgi:hypothetical protein
MTQNENKGIKGLIDCHVIDPLTAKDSQRGFMLPSCLYKK